MVRRLIGKIYQAGQGLIQYEELENALLASILEVMVVLNFNDSLPLSI